jgi:hypothetical protein
MTPRAAVVVLVLACGCATPRAETATTPARPPLFKPRHHMAMAGCLLGVAAVADVRGVGRLRDPEAVAKCDEIMSRLWPEVDDSKAAVIDGCMLGALSAESGRASPATEEAVLLCKRRARELVAEELGP